METSETMLWKSSTINAVGHTIGLIGYWFGPYMEYQISEPWIQIGSIEMH